MSAIENKYAWPYPIKSVLFTCFSHQSFCFLWTWTIKTDCSRCVYEGEKELVLAIENSFYRDPKVESNFMGIVEDVDATLT